MGIAMHFFGREIALATLHGKERVLTRPLWHGLGLTLRHASGIDTNQFGTFGGEIPRTADMVKTAELKAIAGLEALGLDLGMASEGAFGPHPSVPMVAAGFECLVIVDRRDNRLFVEQSLHLSTNFSSTSVARFTEAEGWLGQVGFPSHAVMVRPHGLKPNAMAAWMAKGVVDSKQLADLIQQSATQSPLGKAWLETDMRAHCNPTRMASIRKLAFALVRRMREPCPTCHAPGFGLVDTLAGLPCASCGFPSRLVLKEIVGCDVCGHQDQRPRQDGVTHADPTYCDICNP